jgi:hypothetical protein
MAPLLTGASGHLSAGAIAAIISRLRADFEKYPFLIPAYG